MNSNVYTCYFSGQYSVQVTKGETRLSSTCQVYVQGEESLQRTEVQPELPSFVENLENTEAVDGTEVTLQVKVVGHPVPELSWYLNGENIDNNEDLVITYDRQTGFCKLLFVDIMPEDSGEYT